MDSEFKCELETHPQQAQTYTASFETNVETIDHLLRQAGEVGDDKVICRSGGANLTRPLLLQLREHLLDGGVPETFLVIENFST